MNLKVTKPLTTIVGLISIAIFSIVFQGCEKDDYLPNIDMPYLELSSSIENLNSQDIDIINQAKERLDEYVSPVKGRFILSLKSGKQVNISDELFEYFQF